MPQENEQRRPPSLKNVIFRINKSNKPLSRSAIYGMLKAEVNRAGAKIAPVELANAPLSLMLTALNPKEKHVEKFLTLAAHANLRDAGEIRANPGGAKFVNFVFSGVALKDPSAYVKTFVRQGMLDFRRRSKKEG
jgi:hypothetical protein